MSATLINLVIQIIAGALGGNGAGAALKDMSLGPLGNTIAGAIGGLGGGQLLSALIPALAGATGGADLGALVGHAVGGGIGGAILFIRLVYHATQTSASYGIAAGKQGYIPATSDESFGNVARDRLPGAVLAGRRSPGYRRQNSQPLIGYFHAAE